MKTRKNIRLTILGIILTIGMIACGGNTGNTGDPDPVPEGFTVSLTSSSTNVTSAGQITLTATATNGTLAAVQFLKNGAALGNPVVAPFQFQVDLTSADNGSISFTATGTDTTANTDTSDAVVVTVNIPADTTAPTVSLVSSASTLNDAGTVTLTATANDDTGVARVEFFKNGSPLGQDFTEPFSFQAFLTQTDNGVVSFTAKAFDAAGNASADSGPAAVNVAISVATLLRPSKSSSISISGNNNYIVQANPENDTVSIFTSRVINGERQLNKTAEVPVGIEPSSVVIHPDDKAAFVAVRGTAEVVKIADITSAAAVVTQRLPVGSEPTGIALSPSGKLMVVTEFAESRVSLINTDTMTIISSVEGVRNPRAVAISNDGDGDDTDEKVVITEFYGDVKAGTIEGTDGTRDGIVRIYNLSASALIPQQRVVFPPVAVPDFAPDQTSPNQLYSVIISPDNSKFIVTATAASPFDQAAFNENIYQLLLIGDLNTGAVISRLNVSADIKNQVVGDKLFMADVVDISMVGDNVLYLASRGADAFQRATLSADNQSLTLGAGTTRPTQVDLLADGCQAPIGIVVPHDLSDNGNMYVNCWVSRNMSVIDLSQQTVRATLQAGTPPTAGLETEINKGLRFYFTGRARWSNESWSSCGSCHPDGLSDNITWQFPAGPRQTVSMDGTFSKSLPQKQRILNWTAVFEELHDFERNTRGVSGGVGALVFDAGLDPANRLSLDGFAPVGKPLKELQDGNADDVNGRTGSVIKDWDEIELWSKTIRPPLGKQFSSDASVAAGRALFDTLGCDSCHGGQGWTLSRRFYEPSVATNAALLTTAFSDVGSPQSFQIEAELVPGCDPIAPPHVSCVLRQVGTFGVIGNTAATNELEIKQGNAAARAQGEFSGYNIPSLYGLQAGAPYLHHGQANTLEELLDPTGAWQAHLETGNPNYAAILNAGNLPDLVNFLLSIDATTTEFPVPAGAEKCPANFP